jgi:hypothetical protein
MRNVFFPAILLIPTLLAGCPGETIPGTGGDGGRSTVDAGSSTDGGGTGGTGGADASIDAGPPECFLDSDCPVSTVICEVVRCDPTGHKTDPNSTIIGCFTSPDYPGTPCEENGHAGTCHIVNGKSVCITG